MVKIILLAVTTCCVTPAFCQVADNKDSSSKAPATIPEAKPVAAVATAKPVLKIYPNPAKNKISLQVSGFETGLATVKIIDAKGKTVREDARLLASGTDEINMFLQIQPGIYIVSVVEKTRAVKKKLVVF